MHNASAILLGQFDTFKQTCAVVVTAFGQPLQKIMAPLEQVCIPCINDLVIESLHETPFHLLVMVKMYDAIIVEIHTDVIRVRLENN